MALPLTRNTTYAAGSQLKSSDMNDLQDKLIDEHFDGDGKVSAMAGVQTTGAGGTFDAEGSWTAGALSDVFSIPLTVRPGVRLVAVRARITDDAASGTVTMDVRKSTDGSSASLGTDVSAGDGAAQDLAVTGLTEDIGAVGTPGVQYLARFTFSAGGSVRIIHGIEWETGIVP